MSCWRTVEIRAILGPWGLTFSFYSYYINSMWPPWMLIMKVLETESRDLRIKPRLHFNETLLRIWLEVLKNFLCSNYSSTQCSWMRWLIESPGWKLAPAVLQGHILSELSCWLGLVPHSHDPHIVERTDRCWNTWGMRKAFSKTWAQKSFELEFCSPRSWFSGQRKIPYQILIH